MGCSSCGGNRKNLAQRAIQPIKNLGKAWSEQPDKVKWFKDGATGILKCLDGQTAYTDGDIIANRNICRNCEFSTKTNGKLTATSQCMAIDPETNAPCACIITCKTQVGACPLNKWVHLTIKKS